MLATTVQRERLVAAPDQLTPERRRTTVAGAVADPRTRRGRRGRAARPDDRHARATSSCATAWIGPWPTGSARRSPPSGSSACRSNRNRSGSIRSSAADRDRPSRPTSWVSSTAKAAASTASSSNTRRRWPASHGSSSRNATPAARRCSSEAVVSQAGAPGTDLRLTIDAGLQLKVEQELLAAWVADRAKRASAVVMDPYTGEIYAMATYPSYDGNDYKSIAATDPGRFIDPIVSTRLRARIGVQDDDRGRRAVERDGLAEDPDQGRRDAPPRQGPDQDRQRRSQGQRAG